MGLVVSSGLVVAVGLGYRLPAEIDKPTRDGRDRAPSTSSAVREYR
jgi:hypothetical protein